MGQFIVSASARRFRITGSLPPGFQVLDLLLVSVTDPGGVPVKNLGHVNFHVWHLSSTAPTALPPVATENFVGHDNPPGFYTMTLGGDQNEGDLLAVSVTVVIKGQIGQPPDGQVAIQLMG